MDLPSLSIITVSLNCERILEECYFRIVDQDYPKDKIEMLLIDGGSTDKTKEVARKFGAKIINAGFPENQEARRAIGLFSSKNDILVYIDSDNLLPNDNWLLKMIEPFLKDKKIIATQTLRYEYIPTDKLLNRYFSLFGVNDPVPYYFNKRDRISWMENKWNLLGKVVDENDNYYTIEFEPEKLPTLGCNGFLIKRKILLKAKCSIDFFFHTDVLYDLAKMGFNRYGIVKNSIIHATGNISFMTSLKKRLVYMKKHTQDMSSNRRYSIYNSKKIIDNLKLVKFIFITISSIVPFYDSLRGYLRIRDFAWFLHLPMCWGTLVVYTLACIESFFKKTFLKKVKIVMNKTKE